MQADWNGRLSSGNAQREAKVGRQARWETVQWVAEAMFGKDFTVQIIPGDAENVRIPSALGIDKGASSKSLQIRHWRHSRHFHEGEKLRESRQCF